MVPILGNGQRIENNTVSEPLKLSPNEAVDIALKNNPAIKSANYSVEQQKALQKTAFDLPKTNFTYGVDNTTLLGNSTIGVQQSFSFPTVYVKQSNVLKQQLSLSKKSFTMSKNDLIRNVRSAYYQMAYGVARLRLLKYQDSVYANFAKAATVRYTSGESKYLEKVLLMLSISKCYYRKKKHKKIYKLVSKSCKNG
ncbi:MAG: TolC family protein [Ginsengibacter sp.]